MAEKMASKSGGKQEDTGQKESYEIDKLKVKCAVTLYTRNGDVKERYMSRVEINSGMDLHALETQIKNSLDLKKKTQGAGFGDFEILMHRHESHPNSAQKSEMTMKSQMTLTRKTLIK